jgi:hypothetical protein
MNDQPVSAGQALSVVEALAASIHAPEDFARNAAAAAHTLGPGAMAALPRLYEGSARPPEHLREQFPEPGAWLSAKQAAIFEIYQHLGAPALPELRRVAFGDYGWTQGNALDVLCRLAARGVERDAIVAEVAQHVPAIREEALLDALQPLLSVRPEDPALAAVLAQLRDVPKFDALYREVAEQSPSHPAPPVLPELTFRARAPEKPWWKFW